MIANAAVPAIPAETDELAGKRLALIGFDRSDSDAIAAVLNDAGAFCRGIPSDSGSAAVLARSFDGALVYIGPGTVNDLKSLAAAAKPILAVGSHAVLSERIASIRASAVDCVGYPCATEELLLRARCMAAVPMPGRAPSAGLPVVLIADDDHSIRSLVQVTLRGKLIECHVAEDGATALRMAREIRPSVLVLDVNMPQMDGFEVLSAIRNEAATASIRVLMLTGCEQESDIVRAFGLGADDYLVKPFNPMELAVRIKRLLGVTR
jgi:DNA-binding response OmpR family regulator